MDLYTSYCLLSGGRNSGFAPNPIPLAEVTTLLDELGIHDQDDRLQQIRMIRALDSEFMSYIASKNKAS